MSFRWRRVEHIVMSHNLQPVENKEPSIDTSYVKLVIRYLGTDEYNSIQSMLKS